MEEPLVTSDDDSGSNSDSIFSSEEADDAVDMAELIRLRREEEKRKEFQKGCVNLEEEEGVSSRCVRTTEYKPLDVSKGRESFRKGQDIGCKRCSLFQNQKSH